LGDDEGHYTIGSVTYLKGSVYAPIFEEDMPVQIWTGSATMTEQYKNSLEANYLWKLGLIINISNISKKTDENNTPGDCDNIICTVSYLKDLNDVDETIEKNVSPNRIRLILGSDPMIPTTIEEAHLALIGGEEIIQIQTTNDNSSSILQQHLEQQPQQPEIDENTGLSTWGTVSIRNVSIHHELKEERARIRAQRKAESEREKQKEKEKEARLMEEAKHANADDSALGAYDVWSTATTANNGKGGGYKGVNIHSEVKIDISDTAKSLSEGKVNVQFKKRKDGNGGSSSSFKKVKKVQNQRKTFADDDDE
jgi:WW domain-binding protein 4